MEPQKTSLLAVFALIFSVLCFPLGLLLGVLAIVKINGSNGQLGGKGIAIASIVISAFIMIPGVGCSAAIAIPNFVKFQCRSKQSEAKTNLKMIYVGEMSHQAEHDKYESDLSALEGIRLDTRRYDYSITSVTSEGFEATAVATDGSLAGDTWVIDQDANLVNIKPGC